ncbi:Spore coat polysaccharide biosynthesis protein SpsG, predicted glycosyltransferase [Persephonella hydrogeniphila]|uniref:Spore coat polysaccharide biosynthesis protein SpsG, predicted glycosyltransferase n=1 Tax=Persephonella hydrogeniphila TaxID=198703 RepID=A0A285N731_9AQUI|nr:hypothetical protein [Persephonella hydrogeniphila]SNZ03776.1 Spore coat polysaccharide biosynthesis protein SpsG, predicted glycosyltransferase [Persephonella hydrogeniphila]
MIPKVGLLYDYNYKIGTGHKYRMKALSEYLNRSGIFYKEFPNFFYETVYKNKDQTEFINRILSENLDVVLFDLSTELYIKESKYDLVSIINNLKIANKNVVLIDGIFKEDCLHKNVSTKSDLIIIPYFLAKEEKFITTLGNKFLLGEEYFIYSYTINTLKSKKVKKEDFILISLGGSYSKDMYNLLDFVTSDPYLNKFEYKIITPDKRIRDMFHNQNIHVLNLMEYQNFLYLLKKAKLVITSTGLTKYEALSLNTPVIVWSQDKRFKTYHKKLEKFLPLKYCDSIEELSISVEKLLSSTFNYNLPTKGGEKICKILTKLLYSEREKLQN